MPLKTLLRQLENYRPLSDGFKDFLIKHAVVRSYPSRHILLDVPNVSSQIYYLHEGFAISYTLNRDGKTTEHFWKAGQIVVSFESFFEQKPSSEIIEIVKSSEMVCLSYDVLMQMLDLYPEATELYRIMINRLYIQLEKRLRYLKMADHATQYRRLLRIFPDLEQIVSQRAIATYLGVAPQTLARIRRKTS